MKKIDISTKSYPNTFALVDDEDYDKLNKYKWCVDEKKNILYAVRKIKNEKRNIYLHSQIMKTPIGMVVDHINGDGLDNRRCNLRICSSKENIKNSRKCLFIKGKPTTSKYKGVCFDKERNVWICDISFNKKHFRIGRFKTETEAALAYNKIAIEFFKEFAWLNKVGKED